MMTELNPAPMLALIYGEGVLPDIRIESLAHHWRQQGLRLAGVVQHDIARPDRSRCDMQLELLETGERIAISEDRGAAARGCRMDHANLTHAAQRVLAAVQGGEIDLLVINKFGKAESEGGGMREAIAAALERAIPVVIGVPMRNLDAWHAFAEGLYLCVDGDAAAVSHWCDAHFLARDGLGRKNAMGDGVACAD